MRRRSGSDPAVSVGCRSPDPVHPWSRSSRSPSSPPRSGLHRGRQGLPRRGRRAPLPPPQLWSRVIKGDLPAWRARRVARETMLLSVEAAAYVDRHVAHVAHKVRPPSSTGSSRRRSGGSCPRRPNAAAARPPTAVLHRRHTTTLAGRHQHRVRGARPRRRPRPRRRRPRQAPALKDLGSTDTLDVRRATAVGDLARRQLTLDLTTEHREARDGGRGRGSRRSHPTTRTTPTRKPRQVVLYVHLSDAAGPRRPAAGEFGRVENTRGPVHAEQIRQWCGNPDAQITVKPGHRPQRAHRRRGLRDPRPAAGTDPPDPPRLRVPLVHPTRPRPGTRRARRRLRPRSPTPKASQLLLQHRPPVPTTSPGQDPRRWPTPPWNAGPMCGPAPTATSTSATTTAPST